MTDLKSFIVKYNKISWIILILIGLLLIAYSELSEKSKDISIIDETNTVISYEEELENKFRKTLIGVKGVGNVDVMITLEEEYEYKFAMETKNNLKQIESHTENETIKKETNNEIQNKYVITDSGREEKPIIEKKIKPKIRGVIVVCEGGNNPEVINYITNATRIVFNISSSKISVLPKK